MNNDDATSLSVSEQPKEKTVKPELNNHTDASAYLLPSSITREFDSIKGLIKENRQTTLQKLSTNPALLVVLTFVFTGLAGNVVSTYLTVYQQQLAAERSFIDESNKQRIQKIGEVWEQLDQDEHTIDRLLSGDGDVVAKFPTPNDRAKEIERIIAGDRAMISKYRFWLGKDLVEKINKYLNTNIKYSIKKLSGSSEADLKADRDERDAAKSDFDQIREQVLRKAPESRT